MISFFFVRKVYIQPQGKLINYCMIIAINLISYPHLKAMKRNISLPGGELREASWICRWIFKGWGSPSWRWWGCTVPPWKWTNGLPKRDHSKRKFHFPLYFMEHVSFRGSKYVDHPYICDFWSSRKPVFTKNIRIMTRTAPNLLELYSMIQMGKKNLTCFYHLLPKSTKSWWDNRTTSCTSWGQ